MIRKHTAPRALLLAAALASLAAAPLAAQGTLPPAQQLLDRYAQAVGGRDRVARYTSVRTVSDLEFMGMGIKGTVESYTAKPNRMFMKTELGPAGTGTMGFDGAVGWTNSAMQGPALMEGAELEQRREESDFLESAAMIADPAAYASIQTVERAEMGGKACWKVKLVRKSGRESFNCYDVETGLLAGIVRTQVTQMGNMEITSVVGDYKDFGGVLLPTRSTATAAGQPVVIVTTTRSVEFDTAQPSVFELPQEIRALVAGARKPAS
ncbi:MAG TPA: hypothetical protein VF263_25425 [Longimicrobiaceae bacterium]